MKNIEIDLSPETLGDLSNILTGSLYKIVNDEMKKLGQEQLSEDELENIFKSELQNFEKENKKSQQNYFNNEVLSAGFQNLENSISRLGMEVVHSINGLSTRLDRAVTPKISEESLLESKLSNNPIELGIEELKNQIARLFDEEKTSQPNTKKEVVENSSSGLLGTLTKGGALLGVLYTFKDEILSGLTKVGGQIAEKVGATIAISQLERDEKAFEEQDIRFKSVAKVVAEQNALSQLSGEQKTKEVLMNLEEQRLLEDLQKQTWFERMQDNINSIAVDNYKTKEELLIEFREQRRQGKELIEQTKSLPEKIIEEGKKENNNGVMGNWINFGNSVKDMAMGQLTAFADRAGSELTKIIENPNGFSSTQEGQEFVSNFVPNNGTISTLSVPQDKTSSPTALASDSLPETTNRTNSPSLRPNIPSPSINFTGTQSTLKGVKPEILASAEALGQELGVSSLTISSGYRSPAQQSLLRKTLKGQTVAQGTSFHELGQAIDLPYSWIKSIGKTPEQVAKLAQGLGFRALLEPKNNALHLSMGGERGTNTPLKFPDNIGFQQNAQLDIPNSAGQQVGDINTPSIVNERSNAQQSLNNNGFLEANSNAQQSIANNITNTTVINNPASVFTKSFNV